MRAAVLAAALLLGAPGGPPAPEAFEMTEEGVRRAVLGYFARHGYADVDPWLVGELVREIRDRNRELFLFLAGMETHPELLPHLERYDALKRRALGEGARADVRVVFASNAMGDPRHDARNPLGLCEPLTRLVVIDRGMWERLEDHGTFRESVVFHELGHCDLDRGHDSDFASMEGGQVRLSLMDGMLKARLLWPDFGLRYTDRTEDRLAAVLSERFGGDAGRAYRAMVAELFSRRGTVGGLVVDGEPAPPVALFLRYRDVVIPDMEAVMMGHVFPNR